MGSMDRLAMGEAGSNERRSPLLAITTGRWRSAGGGCALVSAAVAAVTSVRRYSARRRNAMRIGGACTPSRRRTRNCTGAKAGIGNTVTAVIAITA